MDAKKKVTDADWAGAEAPGPRPDDPSPQAVFDAVQHDLRAEDPVVPTGNANRLARVALAFCILLALSVLIGAWVWNASMEVSQ